MSFEKVIDPDGTINHYKVIDSTKNHIVEISLTSGRDQVVTLTTDLGAKIKMKLVSSAGETYVYFSGKESAFIPII